MNRGITDAQRRKFFVAARAGAFAIGQDPELYRHAVMRAEAGVDSLAALDRTAGYEACMIRFWLDAGRPDLAAHYLDGDARRLGWLCAACADSIAQLSGRDDDADAYVVSVIRQAGYPCPESYRTWFLDLPESDARKVLAMLDTHRRRLLRRYGTSPPPPRSMAREMACS